MKGNKMQKVTIVFDSYDYSAQTYYISSDIDVLEFVNQFRNVRAVVLC